MKVTKEELAEKFFWYVRSNFKTQNDAAAHYGVRQAFISGCIKGRKTLNSKMLADIGYKKVESITYYEKL